MTAIKILLMIVIINFYDASVRKIGHGSHKDILISQLDYMKKFNGVYPNEVKLLGNNPLTKRLKVLMKNRYVFLKNTWAVETPIEIKNNQFIAWGCQQHNCSNTNFMIVVDFAKNVVHVGVREEEKVKIYSEDGTSNNEITKWANRN